jgi:hypothetical protein
VEVVLHVQDIGQQGLGRSFLEKNIFGAIFDMQIV